MVEGIAAYYPRVGFERLPEYSPDLAGRIVYPAAFDALGYERPV